jgi:hypothetical protein
MDVVTVLNFFDIFHANHKRTCGAERLDVSADRESDAVRVTLACPSCEKTITSAIPFHDWPKIAELLSDKKRN